MQRALILCISMITISGSAVADDAAAPLAAAVVDATKPSKATTPAGGAVARPAAQTSKRRASQTEADSKPETEATSAKPPGDVQMSGMSVLGNDDSPKSLALVPWKTSQLGDAPSLSKLLDDDTQPVDKDVFMRELSYYQIKTDSK